MYIVNANRISLKAAVKFRPPPQTRKNIHFSSTLFPFSKNTASVCERATDLALRLSCLFSSCFIESGYQSHQLTSMVLQLSLAYVNRHHMNSK